METWRNRMPRDMLLRSAWDETSLSAPGDAGTIDDWVASTGAIREEPIPLSLFLRYSAWFAERFVPGRDANDVALVEPSGAGYRVVTTAGEEAGARRLVIALDMMPFAYVPPPIEKLFGDDVEFTTGRPNDAQRHAGRRVLVVGGGQAGLESAGLTAQAGAQVELVTRSRVHWFADREPDKPRGVLRQRLYRLVYPAVGYGPPPLNRLVLYPDLFARLSASVKTKLIRRLLRPGGSPWLRPLVEGNVRVSEGCTIVGVARGDGGLLVECSSPAVTVSTSTGCGFSLRQCVRVSNCSTAGRFSTGSSARPTIVCSSSDTRRKGALGPSHASSWGRSPLRPGSPKQWPADEHKRDHRSWLAGTTPPRRAQSPGSGR
jgi:FAD-dependent urate hydroxylase